MKKSLFTQHALNLETSCRRMIVGGIPYYISFMEKPSYGNVAFVIEQYYETDEMKLWFLKQNGDKMTDPDVIEYSRSR